MLLQARGGMVTEAAINQVDNLNNSWAENFRMVDIGINAWSSLFDNLKINIILQVW